MDAPRTLVFRPLVKGYEALGTRLGSQRFTDFPSLCARSESSLTNLIGFGLNLLCLQKPFKTGMSLDLARGPDFSGAWQKGPPGRRLGKKRNPGVHFLMVITASGFARGHVRQIAAILQLIGYLTLILRSIDTCQNKVSAELFSRAKSKAQVEMLWRLSHFLEHLINLILLIVDITYVMLTKCCFSIGSRAHVKLTCNQNEVFLNWPVI